MTKIAFIFDVNDNAGGANQYQHAFLEKIQRYKERNFFFEFILINPPKLDQKDEFIESRSIFYKSTTWVKIFGKIVSVKEIYFFVKYLGMKYSKLEKILIKNKTDYALFVSPNDEIANIKSIPLITTVWDIGHRKLPNLPEFSHKFIFDHRDKINQKVLPRCSLILVDSNTTKIDIQKYYAVDSARIEIIGLNWVDNNIPPKIISNFDFEPNIKYLYYPANYWPHKNHLFLLEVISNLITKKSEIKLILTGKDQNNYKKVIQSRVQELGIAQNVIDLGYISTGEQKYLYSNIDVLVFPTLLGPTNIPPYEAAKFGKVSVISKAHEKASYGLDNFLLVEDFELDSWTEHIMKALSLESKFREIAIEFNNNPIDRINKAIKQLNLLVR